MCSFKIRNPPWCVVWCVVCGDALFWNSLVLVCAREHRGTYMMAMGFASPSMGQQIVLALHLSRVMRSKRSVRMSNPHDPAPDHPQTLNPRPWTKLEALNPKPQTIFKTLNPKLWTKT